MHRDDIAAFLDTVNTDHFQKPMTFEECRLLGDFILNVVLSNEGRTMYFDGFNLSRMPIRS